MRTGLLVLLVVFASLGCGSGTHPKKPLSPGDPPNTACATSNACKMWGWCGEKAGECAPVGDDQCRQSLACKSGGLCSFDGNKCMAKTADDCERSDWCKAHDLCRLREGVCK